MKPLDDKDEAILAALPGTPTQIHDTTGINRSVVVDRLKILLAEKFVDAVLLPNTKHNALTYKRTEFKTNGVQTCTAGISAMTRGITGV
jgi:hypothetical protein